MTALTVLAVGATGSIGRHASPRPPPQDIG